MSNEKIFLMNLADLQGRINSACSRCDRSPDEVKLMAVTKTHPAPAADWALSAGLARIGENRVQEAAEKRPQVRKPGGIWELIGPLQSNKARLALKTFDRIQTVDREKLVGVLDRLCAEEGISEYPVLMQVNVGRDAAKHGCETDQARALAERICQSSHLRLEGLMTIGQLSGEESVVRPTFAALRQLRNTLEVELGRRLPELSMGMTGDLEIAIEEGSTLLRVGTALFGAR
jgi:pyridoxal phosphate enzyme (YggS family)